MEDKQSKRPRHLGKSKRVGFKSKQQNHGQEVDISSKRQSKKSNSSLKYRTSSIFYKRPGTTDKGKDFENLNVASMILKLITDDGTKNFKMSSNDEKYGDFDDIVLETESNNGAKAKYALQLKHVNRGKTLTRSGLSDERGNFSIKKYFKNYKQITASAIPQKLILFTNLKFDAADGQQIKLSGEDFNINILRCQPELFLNTSDSHGRCYKFQVDESGSAQDSTTLEDYKQFFDKFHLYTNQINVEKIKKLVSIKFKEMFSCDESVCDRYIEFVAEWSIREGNKEKLKKSQMKRVIAIRVLSQFIEPYSCSIVNDKTKLLRQAISKFSVTLFGKDMVESVKQIYGDFKNELGDAKEMDGIRQKFQLGSDRIDNLNYLSNDQSTKLLWLMNKYPLIVAESEPTLKAIQLCDDAKFILLGEDHCKDKLPKVSIFRNLSDLDDQVDQICATFKCSLQGREEVSLQLLLEQNEEVRGLVTTDELLQMSQGWFNIGEPMEILPEPHIDRYLSTNLIDFKFLNETSKSQVVVISCMKKLTEIKAHLSSFNIIEIRDYLKGDTLARMSVIVNGLESSEAFKKRIYVSQDECSPREFDEICHKNKSIKICHHFRINHDGKLEWVASKGKDSDLGKHRLQHDFVEESSLFKHKFNNNTNLICADPGMGKSVFMKNLKNKVSSQLWTIMIYPKDISSYFYGKDHRATDFVDYILRRASEGYQSFALKFLELLKSKNRIVYFWDGLDEISDHNLEAVLDIIDGLTGRGCIQWITSRSHLRNTLENKLNVLSRNLKEFDEEQQTTYIQHRLVQNYSESDMQNIKVKIKRNIAVAHHNEILGNPLQIFMFTELFRQNPEGYKNLLDNVFSITDLYYHYVDGKMNFHYKGKAHLDDSDDLQKQILDELKKKHLENYEKAALRAHFDDEILKQLNICTESLSEESHNKNDPFGIITDTSDQVPNFIHNSYGEYFAATYFSKNYKNIAKFKQLIFEDKCTNIRFLFDLLLAKNCPVHIAVLYKNMSVLQNYRKQLNSKDSAGRNPLQLACSWGERYPLLNTTRSSTHYLVDASRGGSVKEENPEYRKILEFLIDKCDSKETDDLHQMDSLAYADNSLCLLPLVLLTTKRKIVFGELRNFSDTSTILFYSVKFNYSHMFDLVSEIPYIETKNEGCSLLHLSVECSRLHCLKKILTVDSYRQMINNRDIYCLSPIDIACEYGNVGVVRLLIEHGADINSSNISGATTTYIACQNGHLQVVRLLVKLGADISIATNDGFSPICVACAFGHRDIVKLLIEAGAAINSANRNGATTTYIACQEGHLDVARLLIELGADVNTINRNGGSATFIACQKGHLEVVRLLLKSGADVNIATKQAFSPIYVACYYGYFEIVKLLVEAGADVNSANRNGATATYIACRKGHVEVVRLLIESGADINSPNRNGATTTYIACQMGHVEVVRLLIDSGAAIMIATHDGFFPIYVAALFGHREIVKLLVEAGSDINSTVRNGATPTYIACRKGHLELVRLLIELGADVNVGSKEGFSSIGAATAVGHREIVKFLVGAGADINHVNRKGVTIVHKACERGHLEIVQFLIVAGASFNTVANDGSSPISAAFRNGHLRIVKLLIDSGLKKTAANKMFFDQRRSCCLL